MAMTLRLSDEETELLRQQAQREHRSMQEVVRLAVLDRVNQAERLYYLNQQVDQIVEEDAELLKRLAR